MTLRRVQTAYQAFYDKLKKGMPPKKAGEPRFRNRWRFQTFSALIGHGVHYEIGDRKLRFERGKNAPIQIGSIRIRGLPELPTDAVPKHIVFTRKTSGWYGTVQVELPDAVPRSPSRPHVGVDLGVDPFLTLSTGERIESPAFFRDGRETLRKRQKRSSRRKGPKRNPRSRPSQRWRKANKLVKLAHEHMTHQRDEFIRRTVVDLVRRFELIAVEDLRTGSMLKRPTLEREALQTRRRGRALRRHISEAAFTKFLTYLETKAEEYGSTIIRVNPRYTSRTCSRCGEIHEEMRDLRIREFECRECGYREDRDLNAARVILARAEDGTG